MRAAADEAAEEMSEHLAAEQARAREAHDRLAEAIEAHAAETEQIRGEAQASIDQAEADKTAAELREKLLQVKDPATGQAVFADLHLRATYKGEAMADAPDMSLGYSTAYQSDKSCALGAVGNKLFSPNEDKWSGEHASTEYTLCPGMLFSNRKLAKDKPHIQDLGVTALRLMGADVPADYEGDKIV